MNKNAKKLTMLLAMGKKGASPLENMPTTPAAKKKVAKKKNKAVKKGC